MLRVSKIAPFVAMFLIPISWMVQIMYDNHFNDMILNNELSPEKLEALKSTYVNIPLAAVLTFATVVIPAIMARKAVREGMERRNEKI